MLSVMHARGKAGRLRPAAEGLDFVYASAWLKREDAFPLSPRLPLREEPWQGEEVLFFFANPLPEGNVLDTRTQ